MKNIFKSVAVLLAICSTLTLKAQVPLLSSYASASAVLFLDFDGHTVDGTSWNYSGPIYCGASGLNNTQITQVFNRIAEDYRPFNINVTTDSAKFLAAPTDMRMRVVLTVSSSWYGSAGGVAFVGSFVWGDDTPCFVFSALLNYNVKNISEAASHEAGHTLGLYHQARYDASCVKISDYHSGTGTGEIGWAPIMGVGYYQNMTLWNNGPNSFGCTNYQSDLDILTTTNGFGYRADDYAGTFAEATTVSFTSDQFTVSGVTEQNTDQDMIRFTLADYGTFQLSAIPNNVGTGNAGSNLDMQVTMYNNAQTQLNVYNPGTLLNSFIDTFLSPGTYYLRIEGKGNVYAPNYASLGSYSLEANFNSIVLPFRKLELQGSLNGDKHQFNWIIDADEQVVSQVLEISTDGRVFSPVIEPGADNRSYIYKPYATTTVQYRLRVTFDNDRPYYSNTVTLRNSGKSQRPQLINTITTGVVRVSSPGNYSYIVYDLNGKVQARGQLTSGISNITATALSAGMYMIRFSNVTEQWTDKFVRQ
jgi:hypothetical protein